jgi:hypothetical protein
MIIISMVPKWKCGADNKKVNRNYHQSSVIIGPVIAHTDWEKVVANFWQKLKRLHYTLGATGFVAVIDVVRIAVQLMQSEIKNERFTLISENSVSWYLNAMADGLGVKPTINPFMETGDWIVSNVFQQRENWLKLQPKLPIQYFVFQSKIKEALNTDFINIHKYIKEITHL